MSKNLSWIALTDEAQLFTIIERSQQTPCLIFKHSTRCSISSVAKLRLETRWDFASSEMEAYYLDLIQYRTISNAIAARFEVYHQSPQVLVIKNGECIFDASHLDISVERLHSEAFAG
jgi:bacillithiol system protein YtxJ